MEYTRNARVEEEIGNFLGITRIEHKYESNRIYVVMGKFLYEYLKTFGYKMNSKGEDSKIRFASLVIAEETLEKYLT